MVVTGIYPRVTNQKIMKTSKKIKKNRKLKPIKVLLNGERLRDIYPYATKWEVFKWKCRKFFRKVVIFTLIFSSLFVVYKLGGIFQPKTIYTKSEVIQQVEITAPILEKIADCESGERDKHGKAIAGSASHFGKDGQVNLYGNKNATVDIGKYMINDYYWGEKATELGFNLMLEDDNEAMALWIYKNYGTEPWVHSKTCWNK